MEVVTVAHVDDEKRVDNSLVQIWKEKLGHNVKFLFRLIEHKVSRFGQDFEVVSRRVETGSNNPRPL